MYALPGDFLWGHQNHQMLREEQLRVVSYYTWYKGEMLINGLIHCKYIYTYNPVI